MKKADIPYEFENLYSGGHIMYPNNRKRVCSAIEHEYSYGSYDDKIEIMGLLTEEEKKCDSVIGNLTAEEVFRRIKEHYDSVRKKDE